MNTIKAILVLSLPLALSGCLENKKNTDKLCADNPALQCERLNVNDGQCRIPRTDLIWHRFEVLKDPTPVNKIEEYNLTSAYRKCLELASQIQAIDQADLKQRRVNALVNAGEDLKRITTELRNQRTPESLYFLWSQEGDHKARREFLQLEGKPELETSELQYALATFYTSRDREKTIILLNHALELSKPDNINTEILKSLASNYHASGDKEHAYVWAMVGKEYDVPIASESELALMYGFDEEKFEKLDDIAETVVKSIKEGQYRKSIVPNSLK
ncbi:DUF2989 domain-containing protein [Vibrio diazotrophicus]|uniref:DUF2989 domain-containing protein n=1 Tax=Vibrio diazotrophicus TaxID=685 RepID=UPI000C9E6744|nr:DUF2989 domain-containing protein [Vibrio diazotrophicus]PNH80047.1 DUF2989 domain-containing protein [Vibrio diazotrophicus]